VLPLICDVFEAVLNHASVRSTSSSQVQSEAASYMHQSVHMGGGGIDKVASETCLIRVCFAFTLAFPKCSDSRLK